MKSLYEFNKNRIWSLPNIFNTDNTNQIPMLVSSHAFSAIGPKHQSTENIQLPIYRVIC